MFGVRGKEPSLKSLWRFGLRGLLRCMLLVWSVVGLRFVDSRKDLEESINEMGY